MATGIVFTNLETISVQAVTDLTASKYKFVNFSTSVDKQIALATAATSFPFVLLDGGEAAGSSTSPSTCSVAVGGLVKVQLAAASCQFGDFLTSDSSGNAVVTTTGGQFYGLVAMENGASGDIVLARVTLGVVR